MNFKKAIAFTLVIFFVFSFTTANTAIDYSLSIPTSAVDVKDKVLIPDGRCIGVMLSTNGVMVVDLLNVTTSDGKHSSPAKEAGIKPGDLIQAFGGEKISTVDELIKKITLSKGKKSSITINHNGKTTEALVEPKISADDGSLKIGALVKDAASGIGTLTFYDPQTKKLAALGHGISDPETGQILSSKSGTILSAAIVSVNKGEKGIPGELNGLFKEDSPILGEIAKNNNSGIFGTATDTFSPVGEAIPVGKRNEIQIGKIQILATVDGSNPKEYDAEIIKIMPKVVSQQKGFVIRITDNELIQKTGGIAQGMSGSPIIQNGKIIGAVTHVFVNDPTKGYGIFIEDMLSQS